MGLACKTSYRTTKADKAAVCPAGAVIQWLYTGMGCTLHSNHELIDQYLLLFAIFEQPAFSVIVHTGPSRSDPIWDGCHTLEGMVEEKKAVLCVNSVVEYILQTETLIHVI